LYVLEFLRVSTSPVLLTFEDPLILLGEGPRWFYARGGGERLFDSPFRSYDVWPPINTFSNDE
jgi:type III secretory pathway component EscT